MRKISLVLILLLVAGVLFADVSGTFATETTFDTDATTVKEDVKLTLAISALSLSAGAVITGIDDEAAVDLTGDISYVIAEAVTIKLESKYGIDSVDIIPVTLSVGWTIWKIAFTAKYAFDNINSGGEDGDGVTETGTISIKGVLTF